MASKFPSDRKARIEVYRRLEQKAPLTSRSTSSARPPSSTTSPSQEQVEALARRERVPNRIARGELEGKMTCQRWRALQPDDALRFQRVYGVIEKFPGLTLEAAFSLVATGQDPAEYVARKAKPSPREQILAARRAISNAAVGAHVRRLISDRIEVSVAIGSRTFDDFLLEELPAQFRFQREGLVRKIEVISMAARTAAPGYVPLTVDPVPHEHPAPVREAPEARPFADPRPFAALIGRVVEVSLRHGLTYRLPIVAAGPFDLLLGSAGQELFVPLHAIRSWRSVVA